MPRIRLLAVFIFLVLSKNAIAFSVSEPVFRADACADVETVVVESFESNHLLLTVGEVRILQFCIGELTIGSAASNRAIRIQTGDKPVYYQVEQIDTDLRSRQDKSSEYRIRLRDAVGSHHGLYLRVNSAGAIVEVIGTLNIGRIKIKSNKP